MKSWSYYVFLVLFFFLIVGGIYLLGWQFFGSDMVKPYLVVRPTAGIPFWAQVLREPFVLIVAQFLTLIVLSQWGGKLFSSLGLPRLVGEFLAGGLIVPHILSGWFPNLSRELFPPESFSNLELVSQFSLVIFMFLVGLNIRWEEFKRKTESEIFISVAGLVGPFSLGVVLAFFCYRYWAPPTVGFLNFSVFLGVLMSVIAFPRKTPLRLLAHVANSCAALNATAIVAVLAAFSAYIHSGSLTAAARITLAALIITFLLLRWIKPNFSRYVNKNRELQRGSFGLAIAIFLIVVFSMETIGVSALCGSFLAGMVMPYSPKFRSILSARLRDVNSVILLPTFFLISGARMEWSSLKNFSEWMLLLALVGLMTGSRMVSTSLAARSLKLTWYQSWRLASLLNSPGLLALIVLNLGFDWGIVSARLFTLLVLMIIVSMVMAEPLIALVRGNSEKSLDDLPFLRSAHESKLEGLSSR